MSSENIKTGLRLSEAIKLLEENDGALIKPDSSNDDFYAPFPWTMAILTNTYTVKLPPPKTVTVTKEQLHKILDPLEYNLTALKDFEKFLKELGL